MRILVKNRPGATNTGTALKILHRPGSLIHIPSSDILYHTFPAPVQVYFLCLFTYFIEGVIS